MLLIKSRSRGGVKKERRNGDLSGNINDSARRGLRGRAKRNLF